jgi:predicted DNA-binding transcriptional regulator YafY
MVSKRRGRSEENQRFFRLLRLAWRLWKGEKLKRSLIAEQYQISERSAWRDIALLRTAIPEIIYDRQDRTYYVIRKEMIINAAWELEQPPLCRR